MSTNLGNILVGLGYDLSALEKGAPEAFRLINQQTLGMSAEMKRTSREGAESFRLIDEALGIHISRPITKLLTQEFPGLAKGLASVLGIGLTGALATIAFETFEHVAKSIERAQQAQEEFAKATEKSQAVFEDAMGSYEKAEKLRSLSGLGLELFKIDSASIDEARKKIDELAASFADLDKKEEAAAGWWNKLKAFTGDELHTLYNTPTELAAERISKQFDVIRGNFDKLSKEDALHGTAESARYLSSQLDAAQKQLDMMSAHKMTDFETFLRNQAPFTQQGEAGYSEAEIKQQQTKLDRLKEMNALQVAGAKDKGGQDAEARAAAALQQQHEEIAELQGDLKGYNDEANKGWQTWIKINEEIEQAIGKLGDNALPASAARFAEFQKVFGSMNQVAPPAVSPQRTDLVELEKITNDQTEAWKKAQAVIDQIETPMQKYNTQLQVLKTLQQEGRLSTEQLALAQQQLGEEFSRAQLRVMAMEQELEKLLRHSTSAKDGMRAFLLQLNLDASRNGTFTFDLLNKGLQGFEDETVKALTGAKTSWGSFFESLDQMALKFLMNKLISQLLNGLGGGGGIGGFLGSLFGGGGGGGAASVGSVGSFIGDLSDSGIGAFASGTDSAPGGMAWVGENGPELMNVPAGASITPHSAFGRGGGIILHNHIDARGGEIGVEEKIARALSDAAPHIVMQAVANMSEVHARTPR